MKTTIKPEENKAYIPMGNGNIITYVEYLPRLVGLKDHYCVKAEMGSALP